MATYPPPPPSGPPPVTPGGPSGPRAGFSFPFVPWDLAREQPAGFLELPLVLMDATLSEARYLDRQSTQRVSPETFINTVPISKDSIYTPTGGTVFAFQRRLDELGPREFSENISSLRSHVSESG